MVTTIVNKDRRDGHSESKSRKIYRSTSTKWDLPMRIKPVTRLSNTYKCINKLIFLNVHVLLLHPIKELGKYPERCPHGVNESDGDRWGVPSLVHSFTHVLDLTLSRP